VDFFTVSGSGVGYFDHAGTTNISTPHSTDFDFGTDLLTQEMWLRTPDLTSYDYVLTQKYSGGTGWVLYFSPVNGYLRFYDGGASYVSATFSGAEVAKINQWFHLSIVRVSATVFRFFFNGTQFGGDVASDAGRTWNGANAVLNVGSDGSTTSSAWLGRMDNIRISKGVARYTGTFNPPDDYATSGSASRRKKTNWFFFQ
jgi:hypothetical protein